MRVSVDFDLIVHNFHDPPPLYTTSPVVPLYVGCIRRRPSVFSLSRQLNMSMSPADRRAWSCDEDDQSAVDGSHHRIPQANNVIDSYNNADDESADGQYMTIDTGNSTASLSSSSDPAVDTNGLSEHTRKANNKISSNATHAMIGRNSNDQKNDEGGEENADNGEGDNRTSSPTSVADIVNVFSVNFTANAASAPSIAGLTAPGNCKDGFRHGTPAKGSTHRYSKDTGSGGCGGRGQFVVGGDRDGSTPTVGGPLKTLVQSAAVHSLGCASMAAVRAPTGVCGTSTGSAVGRRGCGRGGGGGRCDSAAVKPAAGREKDATAADGGNTAELMSAQALFRGNIPGLTSFGESHSCCCVAHVSCQCSLSKAYVLLRW